MIVPPDSKGALGPKSIRKPVFFDELFQVTVVPVLTQNSSFDLPFGLLGVTEAASEVRFMSTVQGVEADPQVFADSHMLSRLGSEQTYVSALRWSSAAR